MSRFDTLQDHEFRRDEWDARERDTRDPGDNSPHDRCAYFHESIRMYCGGERRIHAARYVDHEFVEGLVETLLTKRETPQ